MNLKNASANWQTRKHERTLMLAIHGTNTSEGSSVTANCNGLPVCNRIASKLTKVLRPESMSHSLKRESDPK